MKTKEAKHTPGPWRVEADKENEGLHPLHDNRFVMGSTNTIVCALRDQSTQANDARLIASAPEMLEALKVARKMISACWTGKPHPRNCFCLPDRCPRKQVDRAIAKATGAKATGEEGR